jgi:hypothetical protein
VYALPLGGPRDRHIAKHHGGLNVEHKHMTPPKHAKYLVPPGSHGKRLDVPFSDRILRADRVFFVIEGSLKTDAILSQGEAAFGVPSVTLWDAPQLDDFITAMDLPSKQVVIVNDADWCTNPLVIAQAWLCRTYLRDRGVVRAVVAAPPLQEGIDGLEVIQGPFGPLKGVDDFLRAGHSLDELSVLEREPCDEEIALRACFPTRDRRTRYHMMRASTTLPLYANHGGQLDMSLHAIAKTLGRDRKRARKTIEDLKAADIIEVEGDLDADFQYVDKATGSRHDYDWNERPRITFRQELRATERFISLRDLPAMRPTERKERAQPQQTLERSEEHH